MISILLMKKIAELFIVMFSAYAVVKGKILKGSDSRIISVLCMYTVYPCMIFHGFQISLTNEVMQGILLAAGAALIINILFILIGLGFQKLLKADAVEMASVQFSNTANLIVPIVISIFGPEWVVYSSCFTAVQNVFVWTYGVLLFNRDAKLSVKKVLCNPNMIAIALGLICLFAGIRLPDLADSAVDSLGTMAGPCGMIVTGMLLAEADLKKIFSGKRIYCIAFARMIFCPLVVLLLIRVSGALQLLPNAYTLLLISYLAAIAPSAALVVNMAQVYGKDAVYAGTINIFTTLCCIVTMPAFVFLYEWICG